MLRLALFLFAFLPFAAFAADGMRIVCVGDSITHGRKGIPGDPKFPPTFSYRYPLWKKLIDAGIPATFVGQNEGGFEGSPEYATYKGKTFPNVHESWWGWTTDAVGKKIEAHAAKDRADVAIILLGTNDDPKKNGFEPTLEAMRRLISNLRKANPSVAILLARPCEEWEQALGERYGKLALELTTAKSPVIDVLPPKGWVSKPDLPDTATVDWVHPNARGDELLAENFLKAIQDLKARAR